MIYSWIQLDISNPADYQKESILHEKILIGENSFQVRDLFKRINSHLFVVYEVGRKPDIEFPETITSLEGIIILLWNLEP